MEFMDVQHVGDRIIIPRQWKISAGSYVVVRIYREPGKEPEKYTRRVVHHGRVLSVNMGHVPVADGGEMLQVSVEPVEDGGREE